MFQVNGQPNFKYIIQLTNDGYSRYNAMQVTYRQRDWHGLNTMVNFTWSNCIDTNSVNRGGGSTLPVKENPYDPSSNQGPCDTDVRKNFNAGVVYEFPRLRAIGRLGEGWQMTGSGSAFFLRCAGEQSARSAIAVLDCWTAVTYAVGSWA